MGFTLPGFGTLVVYGILLLAALTFSFAILAGAGRPKMLKVARTMSFSVSTLIFVGVALLAYGFLTHDYRIRYVSRYSDRSMSDAYLLTALWGGQDGSLLWWTFLLGGYNAAMLVWIKGKYRELEPYVIATLMVIVGFFCCLMMFPANPFEQNIAGAPPDGTGLNPLLQNYWMIIHPPCLYMGFVGCSVPFAFSIAALVTGRLDREWIVAVRKWMLFAFLFLSIGNVLGMIWAYEELGWGGFWAWDPVENAACLPWFTAAAYVHSTIIQERRDMLKVWNVVLICITFTLTIFGTFLTRSGLIASVHSFAKSDIGSYFLWFLGLVVATSAALILYRIPKLRARAEVESVFSREAMFVVNNWALLSGMVAVLVLTTTPVISEWITNQVLIIGPPFYNRLMPPIGLLIFALMGIAPLFGWTRTSERSLRSAFAFPGTTMVVTMILHAIFGARFGMPFRVAPEITSDWFLARVAGSVASFFPGITVGLAALNVAVVLQEYARGVTARRSSALKKGEPEGYLTALYELVSRARRRYGGYIVHLGITGMFLGFVGTAWVLDEEFSLMPGQSHDIGGYHIVYEGTRMCPGNARCTTEENEVKGRRMLFADLRVERNGKVMALLSPAKFIYQSPPQTTSEVGLLRGFRDDLYMVLATADPQTKKATFTAHVNPFVSWIWIGLLTLILGCSLSLWPEVSTSRSRSAAWIQGLTAGAATVLFSFYVAISAAHPFTKSFTAKTKTEVSER